MFAKDIKIRSNNQIKTSEKKSLIKEILKQYPTVDELELKNIIKVKESDIIFSKITTHDSTDMVVYFIDKIPYFFKFEKDSQLLPSVYFLWKFPNILPKFFTHQEVFSKLVNGADLMLPGVIIPGSLNLNTFKHIQKNELCSVCIRGNEAPVGLGKANFSGEDMYMSAMRGKCLNMIHCYLDNLWNQGDKSIELPLITKAIEPNNDSQDKSERIEDISQENLEEKIEGLTNQDSDMPKSSEEYKENLDSSTNHEEILTSSFLAACKFKLKEIKFPIVVSTFMKIMQSCCPPSTQFDLKKTRYKKISVFLKEMETKGCIKLKDQKGVLSITEIYKENELIKFLTKPEWLKQKDEIESKENVKMYYEVYELYKVDGNSEEIFRDTYKRGDIVSSTDIRQFIMNYIKKNNLQDTKNPKLVLIDGLLNKTFVKNKQIEKVKFDELFSLIFSKMGHMHQIKKIFGDKVEQDPIIKKGKFHPIEFKLESRGGNKKSFLRKEIGCSVSISEALGAAPSSNEFVLSIQGNQIYHVSEILKNEFGIQLKHMIGLEKGVKP